MPTQCFALFARFALLSVFGASAMAGEQGSALRDFLDRHCFECHDAETKKGDLDLTALKFDLANSTNFSKWVLIHDRVTSGEMPPKKKARPEATDLAAFTKSLSSSLASVERT